MIVLHFHKKLLEVQHNTCDHLKKRISHVDYCHFARDMDYSYKVFSLAESVLYVAEKMYFKQSRKGRVINLLGLFSLMELLYSEKMTDAKHAMKSGSLYAELGLENQAMYWFNYAFRRFPVEDTATGRRYGQVRWDNFQQQANKYSWIKKHPWYKLIEQHYGHFAR